MRLDAYVVACILTVATSAGALASSVHATVAVEGRLAVYTGSADGTDVELIGANEYTPGVKTAVPQGYTFEMEDQRYIYLVVWSNQGADGVIGEFFFNGLAVLSGDPAWQVYTTALRITADTAPPGTGEVGRQIRTATRRFAWEKAALNGANEPGAASVVKDISEKAAWMWRPAEAVDLTASTAAPSPAECLIFRISPTELWPEIELWHSRNVGTGPLTGGVFNEDSRYRFFEGGGNSGGGGSGWWPGGPSGVRSIGNPFRDFTPHGSSTVPGSIPSSDDRSVIVIPPADTSSDESKKPPDTPPVVPEPSAGLLMLPAAWLLRRR